MLRLSMPRASVVPSRSRHGVLLAVVTAASWLLIHVARRREVAVALERDEVDAGKRVGGLERDELSLLGIVDVGSPPLPLSRQHLDRLPRRLFIVLYIVSPSTLQSVSETKTHKGDGDLSSGPRVSDDRSEPTQVLQQLLIGQDGPSDPNLRADRPQNVVLSRFRLRPHHSILMRSDSTEQLRSARNEQGKETCSGFGAEEVNVSTRRGLIGRQADSTDLTWTNVLKEFDDDGFERRSAKRVTFERGTGRDRSVPIRFDVERRIGEDEIALHMLPARRRQRHSLFQRPLRFLSLTLPLLFLSLFSRSVARRRTGVSDVGKSSGRDVDEHALLVSGGAVAENSIIRWSGTGGGHDALIRKAGGGDLGLSILRFEQLELVVELGAVQTVQSQARRARYKEG